MLICNCTLCYDNPNACKTCSNYIKEYGVELESSIKEQNKLKKIFELLKECTYYGPNGVIYSSDRYELVEKKDWKIKDLEKRIGECKDELTIRDSLILDLSSKNTETNAKLKELEEELKKLKEE